MPSMVKVACRVANGITLVHVEKEGKRGAAITLSGPSSLLSGVSAPSPANLEPVVNNVDAEVWRKWADENRGKNSFLDSGLIYEVTEARETESDPTL